MKKILITLLCVCLLIVGACAEEAETLIVLSDKTITVNGAAITEDANATIYLDHQIETHEDVPSELRGLSNRVVTITESGVYRFVGSASDAQIAVKAAKDDTVRIILDGVSLSCRTAPAIVGYSAYDPRIPGEYGLIIELAKGSENTIVASHTCETEDSDVEFDGAIGSIVSLGFEGSGSLSVDADNEGIEVASGHMTINGGVFNIQACDDPLDVSEDGVGTLTVNDGYLYSSVKNIAGGEGDGIDSNGYIVFNGGTIINLAHPTSQDSGIDSDLGSTINGGIIVGAGNMYDPIDANSEQQFMLLEFNQETDDLVVVTDENDVPVFAYDFPYDYMYIAFSTPELTEGTYHVYLGGEIEGEQSNGLYTSITSYIPGTPMRHGEGNAQQRTMPNSKQPSDFGGDTPMDKMPEMGGVPGMNAMGGGFMETFSQIDLNTLLADVDLDELLDGKDLNQLLTGFTLGDLLTEEQLTELFGENAAMAASMSANMFSGRFGGMFVDMGGGMGNPRGLQSSADVATTDFELSRSNTGFTNVSAANAK